MTSVLYQCLLLIGILWTTPDWGKLNNANVWQKIYQYTTGAFKFYILVNIAYYYVYQSMPSILFIDMYGKKWALCTMIMLLSNYHYTYYTYRLILMGTQELHSRNACEMVPHIFSLSLKDLVSQISSDTRWYWSMWSMQDQILYYAIQIPKIFMRDILTKIISEESNAFRTYFVKHIQTSTSLT